MDAPADLPDDGAPSAARAWLVYTGLRLAVFLGVAAALYLLLGLNGLLLLLLALLVSSIASLFFLRSQRDALVLAQERRAAARRDEKAKLRAKLDTHDGGTAGG